MRMSQAQRRLALMAAALGTFGAGALLVGVPAGADIKTATYLCTTDGSQPANHQVTVNLSAPATATPGSAFTATVVIAGANPAFTAQEEIPAGAHIQLVPQVSVSAAPAQPAQPLVSATASASVPAALTPGAALPPAPTVTLSVTPSQGTTALALFARDFTLRMLRSGSPVGADLYTCQLAGTATPAGATIGVGTPTPSSTPSTTPPTTTPSSTPTTTPPTPTPQGTHTVEVTVTRSSKVERTPAGGAATGGGGDAGPDARLFVLTGTLMMLGAAAGGLALRRRRVARG